MVKENMIKKYSFLIGFKKSVKNVVITALIPALAYVLLGAVDWMPSKYNFLVGICVAFGGYLIKNYVKNK